MFLWPFTRRPGLTPLGFVEEERPSQLYRPWLERRHGSSHRMVEVSNGQMEYVLSFGVLGLREERFRSSVYLSIKASIVILEF